MSGSGILNPDLIWEEEKEPPVPLASKDPDSTRERAKSAARTAGASEPTAERLQRVAGNTALAREAEAPMPTATATRPAQVAPAPAPEAARAVHATAMPAGLDPAASAPAPAATADAEAAEELMPGREPPDLPATGDREREPAKAAAPLPETQRREAAVAMALGRVLTAFATDPEAAGLLALARAVEAAPVALAPEVAHAVARAAMRADVERRAAIAGALAAELKPYPALRLTRLLAGLLAGVTAAPAPPTPSPAPPPE